MTWTSFHRRGEILRDVIASADRRRDGHLPMEVPGVAQTFGDELALLGALQLRWHTRLAGRIERELMNQPLDLEAAVVAAWQSTAADLPGVRAVLDRERSAPRSAAVSDALAKASAKERILLAMMAGLASVPDERAALSPGVLARPAIRASRIRSLALALAMISATAGLRGAACSRSRTARMPGSSSAVARQAAATAASRSIGWAISSRSIRPASRVCHRSWRAASRAGSSSKVCATPGTSVGRWPSRRRSAVAITSRRISPRRWKDVQVMVSPSNVWEYRIHTNGTYSRYVTAAEPIKYAARDSAHPYRGSVPTVGTRLR